MLKVFTSLSFLYTLTIILLVLYGIWYYRDFVKSAWHRSRFPIVFFVIGAACFAFLWTNMHAPLKLATFSNLDHNFIRQDGFVVTQSITLGKTDTVNFSNNSYNNFTLSKKQGRVMVASGYSEDPLYAASADEYQLLSSTFPAAGHTISFSYDSILVSIRSGDEDAFEMTLNGNVFKTIKLVKKGSAFWNIIKDEPSFINSAHYNSEDLVACLKNIYLLRDNVSRKKSGQLKYFVSGRIFQSADKLSYDQQILQAKELSFIAAIPDKSVFAWGIGFLDNNKNQFRLQYAGADSFLVFNRYPVSYPLTEENNTDWSAHGVNKFLISDPNNMLGMPAVFSEGFLFSAFDQDSASDFAPALMSYRKAPGNQPLELNVRGLHTAAGIDIQNNKLILPARSPGFSWIFSIRNTFNWQFNNMEMKPAVWQVILFGSLLFFFLLVFFTSLVISPDKLSWVWQLLSCVSLVLLTTRFFLYWRYKSFPPYEGMDLPSQQQLNSFWNFGIIVFAAVMLAIVFGFGILRYIFSSLRGRLIKASTNFNFQESAGGRTSARIKSLIQGSPIVKRYGTKAVFFASWFILLTLGAGLAYARSFDPAICRHLAIGLTILYFFFVFLSYNHSPLVKAANESWWRLNTSSTLEILVSNPVKVLLSVSLLAVFVFIDIGFAIVFLNFLLFNEAFLCINYAFGGLSAGSRRNAGLFAFAGCIYLLAFILNLLYAPYIFKYLLDLPQSLYFAGYVFFSIVIAYNLVRLFNFTARKNILVGLSTAFFFFVIAFFFFPKEKILEKAAMTKYRIDVLTMPVGDAIDLAYREGKTYEPVIRAAQNQWFINTLIYEKNNPGVQYSGFHMLPHAPQNKGAKYNAQATDLVASRFFLAEHGKWSVLLYVFLLILPTIMLASFYKLYPDFTNRINDRYPIITAGFSILNYLLITALLVILAATGRYIFFGQDLPFASILSKQSILFPSALIIIAVLLFKNISPEYYANRKKFIPGLIVLVILGVLLFLVKPVFNKDKEFNVDGIAKGMDALIQMRLQPVLDHFDTSASTRRFSMARKDLLFTDSVSKLITSGAFGKENDFFNREITNYTRLDFSRHLEQNRLIYLDLYSGRPQLAVNDNYFRIEPPPHLQQSWRGNVFSDSTIYNIVLADFQSKKIIKKRLSGFTTAPEIALTDQLALSFRSPLSLTRYSQLYLVNTGRSTLHIKCNNVRSTLASKDSIIVNNPWRIIITDSAMKNEKLLTAEPDAFMKNYYVNGSRFYVYPMSSRFIWARNYAENISTEYSGKQGANSFVSLDFQLMDSLSWKIRNMMNRDTAYKKAAEYGICVADGNGRLVAMADFIKGFARPDPNNKAGFNKTIIGDDGFVSQSLLRKQIGNINLLRLNPGPGSTLKPIVFSAVASQLNLDWDNFSSQGFSGQQEYFGGEKVAKYDFEKDNGRISQVKEYLKYSDNYYHANVLLLGSYPRQGLHALLSKSFLRANPGDSLHWPYFDYLGKSYWLDGFKNWPGYVNGKADFGMDSSFASIGLSANYGIYTRPTDRRVDMFASTGNSTLFQNAHSRSGFIMPEYPLFDQQGDNIDKRIPYDVFANCFRGHVKGSSQVLIPPVMMVEAFGKMISQSRSYALTLDPYASAAPYAAFAVDNTIVYNNYLSLMREGVFTGLKEVLISGTAARLGTLLSKGSKYHYYAKTGTTGDNEVRTKSKLMVVIISEKDISDPGFNFRNNRFYTIYFTLQNGPAKQNEEFQTEVIRYIENSESFARYMGK